MNQAIILNDDYLFNYKEQCWQCTGMFGGEKLLIVINSSVLPNELTQDIKFDWECIIEDWLVAHEPEGNQIEVSVD